MLKRTHPSIWDHSISVFLVLDKFSAYKSASKHKENLKRVYRILCNIVHNSKIFGTSLLKAGLKKCSIQKHPCHFSILYSYISMDTAFIYIYIYIAAYFL